jgi:hypothetical protein
MSNNLHQCCIYDWDEVENCPAACHRTDTKKVGSDYFCPVHLAEEEEKHRQDAKRRIKDLACETGPIRCEFELRSGLCGKTDAIYVDGVGYRCREHMLEVSDE